MFTSIYVGGFCAFPGASLAAASAIRLRNRLFVSFFWILPAQRSPVADCTLTILTKPKSVRYMATDEPVRGRGYNSRILRALEAAARRRGALKIVLNARENAERFYSGHGYDVIGDAEVLFGVIRHTRMEKLL